MSPLATLPNGALLRQLQALVARDRVLEADLLIHLGEVDARRLFLPAGCSSMFRYCVEILRLAEAVAYKRIAVARAGRRNPELITAVRRGDLHLTAASLLAPHLCDANASELIAAAHHRSADQVRQLLADRHPKPDVATWVRRATPTEPSAQAPQVATPVAAEATQVASRPAERAPIPSTGVRSSVSAGPSVERAVGSKPPPDPAVRSSPSSLDRARTEPLGRARYAIRFMADEECHEQLRVLEPPATSPPRSAGPSRRATSYAAPSSPQPAAAVARQASSSSTT